MDGAINALLFFNRFHREYVTVIFAIGIAQQQVRYYNCNTISYPDGTKNVYNGNTFKLIGNNTTAENGA
ncbi:hypothetical protein [Mucilaginibacter sp. SJ]|uniref:hypothetical protein n=1 Tax=Mucilaginibacter sp. SJ TaxID=3029053 RepID=UPI0023A9B310|nr:hypothetical protein [Mucilaginibacter sp. SJ]WEA01153.1 hypothetical protein MusilaSJ_27235 [Mucilaginibacter sp. SJ]